MQQENRVFNHIKRMVEMGNFEVVPFRYWKEEGLQELPENFMTDISADDVLCFFRENKAIKYGDYWLYCHYLYHCDSDQGKYKKAVLCIDVLPKEVNVKWTEQMYDEGLKEPFHYYDNDGFEFERIGALFLEVYRISESVFEAATAA